ncbi:COX15/CtaA family protein [Knoellia aerolata]|uniref:COX15/CtaA family protein n=1 Tax=Knoellia aerolata TaxID=442954 RepID=UPI00056576EC|nr:COX15/CtaA family protein [Knoellia aerolata]
MRAPLPRAHRLVLLANLVAQVGIIVTGGLVRLTGSGLGCPTWPECVPGSYVPVQEQAEGFHKVIEFGNRTLTGALGIIAVLAVVAVWRWTPVRRLKVAAVTVLVGVVFQALLGGVTVLTELHPVTVSAHFLVSAGLVAAAAYLWFARHEGEGEPRLLVPEVVRRVAWVTCGVGAVVLTLGTVVTGSGPHSGDADAPARFGFDPRTISWLHADAVMLFVGLVVAVWLATRLSSAPTSVATAWRDVLLVTLGQGAIGYVQYLTDLPEVLVLAHMLGAALLVVALTRGVLALRSITQE